MVKYPKWYYFLDIYNYKLYITHLNLCSGISIFYDSPLESLQLDNFWLDKLKAVEALLFGCFGISSVETPCQNLHIFSSVGDKKTLFNERDQWKSLQNQVLWKIIDLVFHSQKLSNSKLERGAGGVLRQTYTPLYPLFLEGRLKVAAKGNLFYTIG